MTKITCYKCGICFAVPDRYYNMRIEDHGNFWCPNGHVQAFVSESQAEKYKRLYDLESQKLLPMREKLAAEERAKARLSKKLKRIEKRAPAGVCPCCNRTFAQLSAHMATKHKEFMQLNGVQVPKQLKGDVIQ